MTNIGLLVNGPQVSGAHFHSLYKLGRRCLEHTVRSLHVLETLALVQSSPIAVVPDLAVHRRRSSSYVWILAEVLYVQHFDDRGSERIVRTALHQATCFIDSATARLVVILVAYYLS